MTITGRKPKQPALQNIPIRTKLGRRLRDAFKTSIFKDVDYSKVEQSIVGNNVKNKPVFKHNCGDCEFVWHFNGYDWYIHPSDRNRRDSSLVSVVGRYSNKGSDYWSMPVAIIVVCDWVTAMAKVTWYYHYT